MEESELSATQGKAKYGEQSVVYMCPLPSKPVKLRSTSINNNQNRPNMKWIAPSEKDPASTSLEKRLWDAADQFRANSGL